MNQHDVPPIVGAQEDSEKNREREMRYASVKKGLEGLFESYDTEEEIISVLIEDNRHIFQYLDDPESIIANLKACAKIKNKTDFIEAVFKAGKPIVDLKIEKPEVFDRAEEGEEFIKINDLLSYGITGDVAHIHVVPDGKVEKLPSAFKEGAEKLAEIIEKNKTIKIVRAVSWIVAKHPRIMERLGFTLDGEVSEEFRRAHFGDSKQIIHVAHMNREDFLKKYLKQ